MSELRGLEQQLVNLKDQCWNLEQKISYLCECLGGVQTALERGETKPQQEPPKYKGATCRGSYVLGTACGLCERCEDEKRRMVVASKPAPATVEKFNAYEYYIPVGSSGVYYYRKPIGVVVATRDNNGWWRLCFEPNKWSSVYSQEQYEWIVEHNTKSGIWERTNE